MLGNHRFEALQIRFSIASMKYIILKIYKVTHISIVYYHVIEYKGDWALWNWAEYIDESCRNSNIAMKSIVSLRLIRNEQKEKDFEQNKRKRHEFHFFSSLLLVSSFRLFLASTVRSKSWRRLFSGYIGPKGNALLNCVCVLCVLYEIGFNFG